MEAAARHLSFSQFLRHRNAAPDVPEDVFDEHFNDPNWDYSSETASFTSYEEKRQTSSWTDHSFRSSDVESSRFDSSPTSPARLDLREAALQNMNEYVRACIYPCVYAELGRAIGSHRTQKSGQRFRTMTTLRFPSTPSECELS